MIQVIPGVNLDERDMKFSFVRSAGPGGQNVNKVSTACQLRFDVMGSNLPEEVKFRLLDMERNRINDKGELVIIAQRFRKQPANRQDAIDRLIVIVRTAAVRPKKRRATRPTLGSQVRRRTAKERRSQIKRDRGEPGDE